MTNEEAKNLIKRVRTKGSYTGDYYMGFTDSSVPFNADIDILAEALEKQIPTKAKFFKNKAGRGWACGKCGFTVSLLVTDENWNISYETPDYCKWCGQKIDGVLDIPFETGSEK